MTGPTRWRRVAFVTIYGKPLVGFRASATDGCYPFNVSFTDTSVARPGTTNTSWEWDFGNGLSSTRQSPQTLYKTAGNFTVSLKVTNDKGCFATVTKQAYIRVPSGLTIAFDNAPINQCRTPLPVTFASNSTGPGSLSYAWTFGDGGAATQSTATHTYSAPGTYSVSLVVSSDKGCTDSLRRTNLISIQPIETGFKAVDSICVSSPLVFTNASSPSPKGVRWDFGDRTTATTLNATKTYGVAGTYPVRLYNTYSYCTDSFEKKIVVLPKPIAGFSAPQTAICAPSLTVDFKDASVNAVSWLWDFGDGTSSTDQNPAHTYSAYGSYTVLLTVNSRFGCIDVMRKTAFVQIRQPIISFPSLPQSGCIPYTAGFSATVNTLDKVTSYAWDFGDGSSSNLATPTHSYANQGSYPVSLTVTTSTGCTERAMLPAGVVVGRTPVPDFTASPNPVCAYKNVTFNGTTNEGNQWIWDFGDNSGATSQTPTHAFKSVGRFTVALTVVNSGCAATVTKSDLLQVQPPIARFGIQKACGQTNNIRFADSSVGALTWSWNFGDNTTSTQRSPVHFYDQKGLYNVSLTVTNGSCSHTLTKSVSIFDVEPSFTADRREDCKVATIHYNATTLNPADVATYDWRFGNGQTSMEAAPQVTYSTAGNFTTILITTDIYGCRDTSTQANFIRINGPVARFAATNTTGCKGQNVVFTDASSTDGKNGLAQWSWLFGDRQALAAGNAAAITHAYNDTGRFAVQLMVTDSAGCRDSIRLSNLVKTSAPKAAFSSADTLNCLGSTVQFTNRSASAQPFVSQWSFGDSAYSSTRNPTHRYSDTGAYTVSLTITDAYGCADSLVLPRYVAIRKTVARFDMSDSVGGCIPFNVRFTNTSLFSTSSFWRLGRDSSVVKSPVYSFSSEGTYRIMLVAKGRGGCVDTAVKSVTIFSDTAIKIKYAPLSGCRPLLLSAAIKSPVKMNYTWDFGDGALVRTTGRDTTHLFTDIGDFIPNLIVSDSGNCLLSLVGADTVRVKGVVTKFGWNDRLFCDSGTVHFLDSTHYNEPAVYSWNFGDGAVSAESSPSHFYKQPGTYSVLLSAITASGCTDTTAYPSLVKVVQRPRIAVVGDTVVCKDAATTYTGLFLRRDTSATQWYWQFPNGNTAGAMRPPAQRFSATGNFEIKALVVNSSGCSDSARLSLHVNPLPSVSLPASFTSPVGTPVQLQPALYSPDVVSYLWSPAAGLSCTTCPEPAAKPGANTIYTVTASNSLGCKATAQVQVIVFCRDANVFLPNTFSPNGDGSNDVFYVRDRGWPG